VVSDPLLSFALGVACTVGTLKLKKRYASWRGGKRTKKDAAKKAELSLQRAENAEALLKKQGYAIVARDPPASYAMLVAGEPQIVHIHADFLIEKEGKRLVANVRVGEAAKLDKADTRATFIEHQHAFGVAAVLLIDPDASALSPVRFQTALTAPPALPRPARPSSALAQKLAKDKARSDKRRLRLRQMAYALAAAGILYWLFGPTAQPSAGERAPPRVQRARVMNE
jgi:hypothetical protein